MKKIAQVFSSILVCLGITLLLMPSFSAAFETIKVGEESELAIYGFLRNNLGFFLQNPTPFSENGNELATARTWLRGNIDFKYSPQLRFGSVIQFVYEPEYEIEDGAGGSFRTPIDPKSKCCGKEYSEYKDINDVLREAYIEWRPSKQFSLKLGRQIAIWGEALTTRVGDVIQPEDLRFTLAFANLEDTRIPQWMARGIVDFPDYASSFEFVVNPNITERKYLVNRYAHFVSPGEHGQRFSVPPEDRFDPASGGVTNPIIGPPITGRIVPFPFSKDWFHIPGGPGTGWFPAFLPFADVKYPGNSFEDLRAGFRTNTTWAGFNFGLSYFHTQNYDPVVERKGVLKPPAGPIPGEREFTLVYPNIDIIGAYMNKQLPWPGVVRAELIWVPNKPFETFDPSNFRATTKKDYIKYMLAYDLTGFFYFSWHKTAPFDITLEHVGEWIPDTDGGLQYVAASNDTKLRTWNPSFNMRISTNWRYNQIATEVIVGYMPAFGNSGLVMPAIKYVPPILNKQFSVELKYIGIWGKKFEGLGLLRDKDMVVMTTQLNW